MCYVNNHKQKKVDTKILLLTGCVIIDLLECEHMFEKH